MATVHTEYGPGRIIDRETVRGRTRCKVAGEGFEVWIDQAKLGGLDDYDEYNDSADDRDGHEEDIHDLRHRLRAEDDGYGDDDPARYSSRLAWAPLDRGNSTELPYDPEPQHHAVGTPGDDGSSTIQPIHHIDADERLRPSDSISFEPGEDDGQPAPDADLFAREGGIGKRAFLPAVVFTQNQNRIQKALHRALGPRKGQIAFMGLKGRVYGGAYGDTVQAVDSGISQAADWASPGGTAGGYGGMIHNAGVHLSGPEIALLAPLLRTLAPMAVSGLMGGGDDGGDDGGMLEQAMGEGNDFGPGEGYGGMIQASKSLSELFPPSTWDEHDERHPREHEGSHRPAGLSDRYIDITAELDHHDDPVAQFRHDPAAYINRVGHLKDEGLNPRFAEYMDLVEADGGTRTAAWKDVRKKAMRLKREGHVTVKDMSPGSIMASVIGDHGTYDVVILKGASINGVTGSSIANWHCDCEWGKWAFRRKYTYVGRLCSHAYASYLTMQSAAMKGKPRRIKRGPSDTIVVNRPSREQYLPTFTYAAGLRHADALQNGPERLTPELVVNDADDAHIFLDVEEDEREDTGPDDVMSDRDIVHFARLMRHCEVTEQPYPRQLVAFLSRYADCNDGTDDTQSDYKASDADDANEYLQELRSDADRKQENDFGNMSDRVHKIQDAVEEARSHGADASRFVAQVRRMAEQSKADSSTQQTQGIGDIGLLPWARQYMPGGRAWNDSVKTNDDGTKTVKQDGKETTLPGTEDAPQESSSFGRGSTDSAASQARQPKTSPISPNMNGNGVTNQQAAPAVQGNGNSGNGNSGNGGGASGAGAGGGGWKAPPGGTTGPVADGGVRGAENGNNAAIIGDTYTVQQGDTATDIAQRAYGDMNRYKEIADANGITDVDFGFKPGQEIKLNDAKGNGGVMGFDTNPAGGGADKDLATPNAGPAAAPGIETGITSPSGNTVSTANGFAGGAPPQPAQPAQTSAEKPATITAEGSLRTARDWLRWAAEGDGTSGEASPSANDQAAGADPATAATPAVPSPGAKPATNPATTTEQAAPNKDDDTLDPNDPQQVAQQQQARPGQQPANPTPPTTGMGLGGSGGGMDMSGIGDMINTGVGAASNIASGIGGALNGGGGGLASGIGGLASGIGSAISGISGIFSSRQDAEDWRRYAYPEAGDKDSDFEPHTHPFAGSGWPGPLEFGTSEEYADKARKKHDDVTDLGDDPLSVPMGEWQKQGGRDDRNNPFAGWESEECPECGADIPSDDAEDEARRKHYEHCSEYSDDHFRKGSLDDDASDIVRAFQANMGNTALGSGAGGGGGRFDDFSGAAAGFLRTAGRNYSMAEQSELIREGDKGGAGNLGDLDLRGTHYEDMTTLGW